ncbi:MAG: membrane protein insertase YidC [Planctomycetales bacterium]|nr:membrane protein insertase YidC [Planctomycetales bacterium]NIM10275.1 membrane protein insertase YidC [Planctomycetales bacterium]NIN09713.1 membrane protein insertase YidC [Planctomycetales bacterium]NIN78833.1 membrane protein insertase YidC [Planctomycetales bacterium]NIO36004.1 membrane protein insertase YidC [Planctomycetales bacterium]
MEKRFFLFLLLSLSILMGTQMIVNAIWPPPPRPEIAELLEDDPLAAEQGEPTRQSDAVDAAGDGGQEDPADGTLTPPGDQAAAEAAAAEAGEEAAGVQRVVLGSLDPASDVRMLIYFTNRGAAIERIVLNNPHYGDLDQSSGFLGFLGASDAADGGGCLVGVVGPGTPAATAGLEKKDVITAIDQVPILTADDLFAALGETQPGQEVVLKVLRGGKAIEPVAVTLARRQLQLIRPELGAQGLEVVPPGAHDQLSMLMTLEQIGDERLPPEKEEFEGVSLRESLWRITKSADREVEFRKSLSNKKLTVVKRYRLASVDAEATAGIAAAGYHLLMDIEIINEDAQSRPIAYRLDGPTGLPTEGWWWSNKFGRQWGGRRLRDVALHLQLDGPVLIDVSAIVDDAEEEGTQRIPLEEDGRKNLLAYAGVDAQYFAAVLLPQRSGAEQPLFASVEPRLVGDVPLDARRVQLSNVTCRLTSRPLIVAPGNEERMRQSFVLFAGPKVPDILAEYKPNAFPRRVTLEELIYFGWPIWGWFARPLSAVLHFFYGLVGNYGLAIVMLTVLVRLSMFPLSRKQALGAQKMQELQPEIKRISEKYKNDLEKRSKAIQEMYKKHNYNPLSGCLPLFIQLPIFIGLYRALMVDIELRQAPLISAAVRWCSNLAAPDMLWFWQPYVPEFLSSPAGWLGPYLNILPLFTVVLFIWQQKMFMPPPTDEQAAMQQKIMQYMMIFMGFLFFKVASGLCIYFIASSLWGVGERKLLPKSTVRPAQPAESGPAKSPAKELAKAASASGSPNPRRKKRKK